MDVKVINPILDAFAAIVPKLGFSSVVKKGVELKDSNLVYTGVLINIGVLGPLKGAILIGMGTESAQNFASRMMMGAPVTELDALAQSAIAEMGNMVCANACTNFTKAGIDGLDISPPTILIGKEGQIRLPVSKIIIVKFDVDGIDINVYVGLNQ